ncbi:MAG: DMT family transporter [Maricaulaceae bacterium]|jgi:drug/metabolite transporter (DMT)-like permease
MSEDLSPRERLIALAALVGGGTALGTAAIFVRLAEDAGVGPSATAFWRLLFALGPLTLWALLDARRPAPAASPTRASPDAPRRALWFALLAGFLFAGDLVTWHAGIVRTSAANATLFANLTPAVVALGAWVVFRERPSGPILAALAMTLTGAALLSSAGLSAETFDAAPDQIGERAFGDVLSVLTAFWYAAYMLAVKAARGAWSTVRVMAVSTLVSAPCALAAALILGEPLTPTDGIGWLWLLGLALITHIGGQGGLAYGLGRLPAALSALVVLIQPVVASLLAWVLFAEALGPLELSGGALVIVGVIVAQRRSRAVVR